MAFRLVNKHKLLAPRKCIVCEHVPQWRVCDTGHKFVNIPPKHPLYGRKYVCEGCAEKVGKALGMPTQAKFESVIADLVEVTNHRNELAQQVTNLTEAVLRNAMKGVEDALAVENKDADPA